MLSNYAAAVGHKACARTAAKPTVADIASKLAGLKDAELVNAILRLTDAEADSLASVLATFPDPPADWMPRFEQPDEPDYSHVLPVDLTVDFGVLSFGDQVRIRCVAWLQDAGETPARVAEWLLDQLAVAPDLSEDELWDAFQRWTVPQLFGMPWNTPRPFGRNRSSGDSLRAFDYAVGARRPHRRRTLRSGEYALCYMAIVDALSVPAVD